MKARLILLALLAVSAAVARPTLDYAAKEDWQHQRSVNPASTASSTSASAASQQTPGFALNGTIGSFPCVYASQQRESQLVLGAGSTVPGTACSEAQAPVYPYNAIELRAPDDSIRATILPYAATVSELWVKDRYGGWRDIVLGYDNKTNYGSDPVHPNFSPIVGRYANRIKNGTFHLDGKTYNIPKNENNLNTLHGGTIGYDRSNFTIKKLSADEIILEHVDPDGYQGFPGRVITHARYSFRKDATWNIVMNATATARTPIMLSSHVYWNLAAFNETQSALGYVLHMPYAKKYVETDAILVPTGPLPSVKGTPYDFLAPTAFNRNFNDTLGVCGYNCTGWDSCWIMPDPPGHDTEKPVIDMYSPDSGIKVSVASNQAAMQVYSCPGVNNSAKGSLPRKLAHGGKIGSDIGDVVYDNYQCIVLEMQDYIDGINHPNWGRDQIYGPDRPYHWQSTYTFTNVDRDGKPI